MGQRQSAVVYPGDRGDVLASCYGPVLAGRFSDSSDLFLFLRDVKGFCMNLQVPNKGLQTGGMSGLDGCKYMDVPLLTHSYMYSICTNITVAKPSS